MTCCHSDFLETKLLESLRSETQQSVNTSFELVERDPSASIIGGLVASVSYGWLLIKIVWVDKTYRNKGIASNLISLAEGKAIELGCHSAWLDTSNPVAMKFYISQHYVVFGKLSNNSDQIPPEHQRWFMKKCLTEESR